MAAKKTEFSPEQRGRKGEPDRLKIEGDWKEAARKLLAPSPNPAPPRQVKPRKKAK